MSDSHHETNAAPDPQASVYRWGFELPLEWLFATALFIATLPLTVVLIALVRITSPGPGVFRQTRVGLHGRVFEVLKIRTMRSDAELHTGPVWAQARDSRITPLGRFLRATHLDELPQLWNVVRGDMTLIGPRPERPEFVKHLATVIPRYLERLTVMPGITGLAQVNLPADTDYESVWRKLTLDLEYIATTNWRLDLRIMLSTVLRVCGISRKRATTWLGINRNPPGRKFDAPVVPGAPLILRVDSSTEEVALLPSLIVTSELTSPVRDSV